MAGDLVLVRDEMEKNEQIVSVGVDGEHILLIIGPVRVALDRDAAVRLAAALLKADEVSRDTRKMGKIDVEREG